LSPGSIVCSDGRRGYNTLDVSAFEQFRINHSGRVAEGQMHMSGIETFWTQAKRLMRTSNGAPKEHFKLYLKK